MMYEQILQAVKIWLAKAQHDYADTVTFEDSESPHGLNVNMENAHYIAHLNVSEPDCRPYRYVEFYVLDAEQEPDSPPAFVYQDKDGDTVSDVLAGLDAGIRLIGGGEVLYAN